MLTQKEKLNEAFRLMRRAGLIARQNFKCCSNCAGYAIAEQVSAMPEHRRKEVLGTVFYHRQDAEMLVKTGETYLAFGPIGTAAHGEIGFSAETIGIRACAILKEVGLEYEWDGSEQTRILVKLGKGA